MHMRWLLLMAPLLVASGFAIAQGRGHVRYQWQDAQGLVHFSDSLTQEAIQGGYSVIDDRGIVVARVARPPTAEERAAAAKQAEQDAAKQRAARQRANSEAQMLNAYPTEAAYRTFQKQSLETIDQQIHTTQLNLRSQEDALTTLLNRAGELERAKEKVPPFLVESIAKQRDVITAQRATLQRQQAMRAQTVEKQGAELARYRELKAAQDKAAQ